MTPSARAPIDVFFDFSSPYAYLATPGLIALAARHARTLRWRPIMLGAVFKITGGRPLVEVPMKDRYLHVDVERFARKVGLPLQWPKPFPFKALAPSRAFYWIEQTAPDRTDEAVQVLLAAAFGDGRNLDDKTAVAEVLGRHGFDDAAALAAMDDPEQKTRLKTETDLAIAAGVFGSPFVVVDGEPFWGADRLDHVDWWLSGAPNPGG